MRALASALVALVLAACAGGGGELRPAPLPAPDEGPAVRGPAPRSPRNASYTIRARYDAATHRIGGSETLRWKNIGRQPVRALPFHLYMNAFKNRRSLFWRESGGHLRRASAKRGGWGSIALSRVAVAGAPVALDSLRTPGPDETVVEIPLASPVAPGEEVSVELDFEVQLPRVFARTGYAGDFAMVGQWFPKIGVRGEAPGGGERWYCEPFHANSEFFADFGTYDVELDVPSSHVVAATGVLVEAEDLGGGRRRLRYRAEDVHDFAWMIDPHMAILRGTATTELGPVEVRVYHRPAQRRFAERHLAAAIGAIESLSRRTLPYPWPIMSIVDPPPEAAAGAGGMEYPTLVTTAGDSFVSRPGVRLPEFVTIHEVGHNWFQGMLASNEVEEAWLDEGVNEYIDCVVMNELYGTPSSQLDALGLRADPFLLRRAATPLAGATDPIDQSSYRFATDRAYARATYQKTALALRTLENLVGREPFAAALRDYARRFAFHHPSGEDFFASLEQSLGRDLDWFVDPVFRRRGVAELVVEEVRCSAGGEPGCRVVVGNTGEVSVPYDVELRRASGATERRSVPRGPLHRTLETGGDDPVVAVTIDPDNRILINGAGMRSLWRDEVRLAPAARAAGDAQALGQALLQLVGL